MDHETPPQLYTVYITAYATGEMTLFDWGRNLEEIHYMLLDAQYGSEWGQLRRYGPQADGSIFYVCFEAVLMDSAIDGLVAQLQDSQWVNLDISWAACLGRPTALRHVVRTDTL